MSNLVDIKNSLLHGHLNVPDQDLLYISMSRDVPTSYSLAQSIRVFTDSNGKERVESYTPPDPEPSTIYVWAKIEKTEEVEKLGYYPSYYKMTPGQRYKYIVWLSDVSSDVEVGYLFVYFYGLERQLLEGNFDKAFDKIISLRNFHNNASFRRYSESALIHSCIIKNRLDKLYNLHEKTYLSGFSNAQIMLSHKLKLNLSALNLINFFYCSFKLARKAVMENKPLLLKYIEEVMSEMYPEGFPLSKYGISNTRKVSENRFANHSFDREIRWIDIIDFYSHEELMKDIEVIFRESYQRYKNTKAIERFEMLSKLNEDELAALEVDRKTKKYEALLKKKAITKSEFSILIESISRK